MEKINHFRKTFLLIGKQKNNILVNAMMIIIALFLCHMFVITFLQQEYFVFLGFYGVMGICEPFITNEVSRNF